MVHRSNKGLTALVAIALASAFVLAAASEAPAQEPATKTMYAVGRGNIQVIRLYDKPDPLGTTMEKLLPGSEVVVQTDQLFNNYWYKTSSGLYAHIRYLSETDPLAEMAAESEQQVDFDAERENALLAKYSDLGIVQKILAHQVEVGFTMDQVRDSWGQPDSTTLLESTSMGDRWQWRYEGDKKAYLFFDERKKIVEIRADKR